MKFLAKFILVKLKTINVGIVSLKISSISAFCLRWIRWKSGERKTKLKRRKWIGWKWKKAPTQTHTYTCTMLIQYRRRQKRKKNGSKSKLMRFAYLWCSCEMKLLADGIVALNLRTTWRVLRTVSFVQNFILMPSSVRRLSSEVHFNFSLSPSVARHSKCASAKRMWDKLTIQWKI